MSREEILNLIRQFANNEDCINENTVIAENDLLDSMSLLSIFIAFKDINKNLNIRDVIQCKTVSDLIDIVLK